VGWLFFLQVSQTISGGFKEKLKNQYCLLSFFPKRQSNNKTRLKD
jgi:hypothetical protein